jgi:hypothetical protein
MCGLKYVPWLFSAYLTSFSFDDDSLFLRGLGFELPLGNGILMKMWQHFLEWTLVDGWSNGVTLITCKRQ